MDTEIMRKSGSADETKRAGAALGVCLHSGDVVLLSGDLGAGKTQFVQGVARALGVAGEVTSPTFNILLTYGGVDEDGHLLTLNHFDLYRLERPEQLVDIDFAGVLESGGVCFIEWADKFPNAMPDDRMEVSITADAEGVRTVSAVANGERSKELLAAWRAMLGQTFDGEGADGSYRVDAGEILRLAPLAQDDTVDDAFPLRDDMVCRVPSPQGDAIGDVPRVQGATASGAPHADVSERFPSRVILSGARSAESKDLQCTEHEPPSCSFDGSQPGASQVKSGNVSPAPAGFAPMSADSTSRDVVLAFDTSNEVVAIAFGQLNPADRSVEPIITRELPAHRASNTRLLPEIDSLMAEAGLSRERIACVSCGLGPGSFTGVRICLATAKGIAMALEVGLYGVSTPDAVAWKLWADGVRGQVAVVADAMRKEVYPVRYAVTDEGIARGNADVVMKAEEGVSFIGSPDLVTGDGLVKYADLYEAAAPLADEGRWTPTGAGLLLALQAAWRAGELNPFDAVAGNPAFALPVYTRLSDAEENERTRLADTSPRDLVTGVQARDARPDGLSRGSVAYRPLDAAHAADVARMEADLMGSDAWNEAMVADELPRADRIWWAAYDGAGTLIGYAGALVVDGDMQILKIGTARDHQREGIATQLLAHVSEDARALGAGKASLEVRVGNAGAIRFYEALGFSNLGRRPRYYSDREDAFILEGPLPLLRESHTVGGMEIKHLGVPDAPTPVSGSPVELEGQRLAAREDAHRTFASGRPADSASIACDFASENGGESVPRSLQAPSGLQRPDDTLLLAIESSCDETAAAVVDGRGHLHSDVVASQIDFHARFGGVVPEIASRKHIEAICGVVQEGLDAAAASLGCGELHLRDLDAISATYAPGLVGALVVGVAFAKGAAWGADIPFIGVNHLEGHLYANRIATADIQPPMVVSLVSGGHTMLVHVRDWGSYETLGSTIDDAVGEAFDKVAKALGLGYPGGPVISKLAAQGNPKAVRFPRAMMHSGDLRFSLSGLKTAVITYLQKEREAGRELNLPDIAASFQQAVIDVQVAKARTALEDTGAREFCLGGGVAANPALRAAYQRMCDQMGVRLTMPPLSSCTDNAGMIALVALDRFEQGKAFGLDADVQAHAPLDQPY